MWLEESRPSAENVVTARIYRANPGRSTTAVSRLNPVDYRRFDKFLRYIGCEFVRQKGDHRIYRKANLKR
ncbi:MAG TPA: hypothetical protein DEQ77_02805, partial [Candidatus Omnitrophica bacterium]|nr:hypothetical protein [Candidatus Omnitrophota bacterium]